MKTTEQKERERIQDILAVSKRHGFEREAEKAIADGTTIREFNDTVLNAIANGTGARAVPGDAELGMSKRDLQQYSLFRAAEAIVNKRFDNLGIEMEAHTAVEKIKGTSRGGLYIPYDVLRTVQDVRTRAMNTASGPAGGYLVQTSVGQLVELFRNESVCANAGAILLPGINGEIDLPKHASGASGAWIGEGHNALEGAAGLGNIALRPRTYGVFTDITRRLRLQASYDVEMLVRGDLAASCGLGLDAAAINGAGTAIEPLGIINTTGCGSVTLGAQNAPTWENIVDLETAVGTDNALRGSLAYVANWTIAGAMKKTPKETGFPTYLMENGMSNGYTAYPSGQCPDLYMIFGNWRDMIIATFGPGLEITADAASLSKSGGLRIVALVDCDVAVRHPESFAVGYHV